jgi:hypothetical protein
MYIYNVGTVNMSKSLGFIAQIRLANRIASHLGKLGPVYQFPHLHVVIWGWGKTLSPW